MAWKELTQVKWDGVFKSGEIWVLYDGDPKEPSELKSWFWAPLWWVRTSCLLHGWGWPKVRSGK